MARKSFVVARLVHFWQEWTRSTSENYPESGHEFSTRAVAIVLTLVFLPLTWVIAMLWSLGLNEWVDLLIILGMDILFGINLLLLRNGNWKLARWLQQAAFLVPGIYHSITTGVVGLAVIYYSIILLLACLQLEVGARLAMVLLICLSHIGFSLWNAGIPSMTWINDAALILVSWVGGWLVLSLYETSWGKKIAKANSAHLALQNELSERAKTEQELQKDQALLNAIINNMPFDFWVCDRDMRYFMQNPISERRWGPAVGKQLTELNLPDEVRARWMVKNERALSGEIIKIEESITHAEGSGYYYSLLAPVRLGDEIVGCLGMNLDITDRKRAEWALRENEERLRQVLQNMPVMLTAYNEFNRVIVWNRECELVTGYPGEEMIAHPYPLSLLYPDPGYRQQMLSKLKELQFNFRELELDVTCKSGVVKTISWSNLSDRFPVPGWHTWQVGIDVTERKMTEQRLRYWGHHDSLTGLYNRSYFSEELGRLRISRQFPVSIIMMDVDDLKSINDTMGHLQGDELLKRIANVISRCFRGEDVIARIGGDEFAVLLPYTNQNEVVNAVERLKHNIEIKNQLGEKPLLGLSIGFATAENGYELQQAYDLADIGMYKDKALRKKTGPLRDYRI